MTTTIRQAVPDDVAELTAITHELAAFEREADQCTITATQLHAALFGPAPMLYAHVAEVDGEIAASAVWFRNFSTWDAGAGIYLEDLFVRDAYRRRGLARALLGELAKECMTAGYTRLTWAVLDWNVDAIALYDSVGGRPLTEWTTYCVSGPALSELAESELAESEVAESEVADSEPAESEPAESG